MERNNTTASEPPAGPRVPHTTLYGGSDLFRMAGLTDALFAIVLTLLVLELRLPETNFSSDAGLLAGLASLAPVFFAYGLTFAVGGLQWLAHHRTVAMLERYDTALLVWNLMFLGVVSALPFSSALVGRNGDLFWGWTLYAANMVLIGLAQSQLVHHAIRHDLLRPDLNAAIGRSLQLRALGTPLVFSLSILVALVSTAVAHFVPLLLIVFPRLVAARAGSG